MGNDQDIDNTGLTAQPGSPPKQGVSLSTSVDSTLGTPAILLQPNGVEPTSEWVYDLDPEVYHADKTRVSSSILKTIRKSARTFWGKFHGVWPDEDSDARLFGRAVHCALLEGMEAFNKRYVVMPKFTGKTLKGEESAQSKEAREKKAMWLAALPPGIEVVTTEQFTNMNGVIEAILDHPDAVALLKNGAREVTGYTVDPVTGIRLRLRPDFLSFNLSVLVDFKACRDVTEFRFQRQMVDLGWDFSEAFYSSGIELISGKKPDYVAFVAVESEAPYECAVYIADHHVTDRGFYQYRQALDTLKSCIVSNQWPRYQEKMKTISLPNYLLEKADW